MMTTAYDWINNLKETSTNLGMTRKVKTKFNKVDSIDNITELSGELVAKMIHNCIEEKADIPQLEIKDIQLHFRHESDHGHHDAGHMTIVTKRFDKDTLVSLLVLGGQYDKLKMMCISVTDCENMTDAWHKKVSREMLVPKVKKPLYDIEDFDEDYKDGFMLTLDIDGRSEAVGKLDEEYGHYNMNSGYFQLSGAGEFYDFLSKAIEVFKMRIQNRENLIKTKQFVDSLFFTK